MLVKDSACNKLPTLLLKKNQSKLVDRLAMKPLAGIITGGTDWHICLKELGMKSIRLIAIAVLGVMAITAIGCGPQQDQAQLEAMYAENQTLRSQKQELQVQIAEATQLHDQLADQMNAKDQQLVIREAEISKLNEQLSARIVPGPGTAEGWQAGKYSDKVMVGGDILFSSGQAALTSQGKTRLAAIARDLKGIYAGLPVLIYGHTDSDPIKRTATLWADNLDLSLNRSAAVARFLIAKGVKAKRIETVGMGSAHPVSDNSTKRGKAKNRRVEIVVLKTRRM